MSSGSGAGAPPPSGVVRSSALSFVAPAQLPTADSVPGVPVPGNSQDIDGEQMAQNDRLVPLGLKALCETCSKLYSDQPNPLQVTTRLKYWLGGHDPLDYISMYWNPGKPEEHILPHWHYVSFGLSDLHGDGRVHPPPDPTPGAPSGYGFELTFRLSAEGVTQPPLWPAALLQALARYVFTTGNKLCAGDHISWHRALDGGSGRLRHLLVAEDPQLTTTDTAHGQVNFLQMVGCTGRELKAAQRGSGFEVLKLIAEDPNCGGSWLVTRVNRRASAKKVRSSYNRNAPAQLAGVSARVRWVPWTKSQSQADEQPASPSNLPPSVKQEIKETLQRGLNTMTADRSGPEGHMSTDSFEMSSMERALPQIPELMEGSWRGQPSVEYLDGVHIILNPEGASLLPLAIDGRIAHGSHFTWRDSGRAVTFLPPSVTGANVSLHKPYALQGNWLQVMIPKDVASEMSSQLCQLSRLADSDSEHSDGGTEAPPPPSLPARFCHRTLTVTVVHDHHFL